LVKEHGLNVYFDGDFSGYNPLWKDHFPENMESGNCRGVVAFIDDAYTKSYVQLCVERFLVMLMLNDNVYSVGVTINDIVSTIKDVCGEEVVSDITANTDKGYS
jgi:hypothetical protein